MMGAGHGLLWLTLLHFQTASARKRFIDPRKVEDLLARERTKPKFSSARKEEVIYNEALAAKHKVTELPGLPHNYTSAMYAGDVSVNEPVLQNNGSLFYWLFESLGQPETDPLVIWLNGGPGCSSLEGLLVEHGPLLATKLGLELNRYPWNRHANVMYLDQPVGTGFATVQDSAYAQSQNDVNLMFMAFLQRWMLIFPQYKHRPLFFAGESYAGRYIPNFAHQILSADVDVRFNLQGVLLGNAWIHPMVQSESLPELAFGAGFISDQQKADVDKIVAECRRRWDADPYSRYTYFACEQIQAILPDMSGNDLVGVVNTYDVRSYDSIDTAPWPPGEAPTTDYLRREDVKAALHSNSAHPWEECNNMVDAYLAHEDMYPTVQELQDLLPHIRVLLFSGQFDWICNHIGTERLADAMEFEGRHRFVDPDKRGLWVSGSRLAGYVKEGGNLTFLSVLGGSHMVPMDKRPQVTEMLERFLRQQSLSDIIHGGTAAAFATDTALDSNQFVADTHPRASPSFLLSDLPALILILWGLVLGLSLDFLGKYARRINSSRRWVTVQGSRVNSEYAPMLG